MDELRFIRVRDLGGRSTRSTLQRQGFPGVASIQTSEAENASRRRHPLELQPEMQRPSDLGGRRPITNHLSPFTSHLSPFTSHSPCPTLAHRWVSATDL